MDYHSERTDWAATISRALVAVDPSTASPPHCEKPQPASTLTSMAEAIALRDWALSAVPVPSPAASPDQLVRHLEFLASALPTRAIDAETGRKRFAVYASVLGDKSNEALAFMARRACETLDWFPTPKQCLDILALYRAPVTPQAQALIACRHFTETSFDQWIEALRSGGPIGDASERWQRIAVEQGAMRRLADGTMVSRALYHGPPCPPHRPLKRQPVAPPRAPVPGVAGASAGLLA